MSSAIPIGLSNAGLAVVMQIPGIAIDPPVLEIGGVWLRRLCLGDYLVLEDADLAFDLAGRWDINEHVFCAVTLDDFTGDSPQAEDVRRTCLRNLRLLLRALRLHRPGPVIDPAQSTLFLRNGPQNARVPGLYRHRLLEERVMPTYHLTAADDVFVSAWITKLSAVGTVGDQTIGLALRHFDWASQFGLRSEHRAALLFVALEATYGEYGRGKRPSPKCSLGQAAAEVSRSPSSTAVADALDGPVRDLRNRTAHGAVGSVPEPDDLATLETSVRDGLRALVTFAAAFDGMPGELNAVTDGMSDLPIKLAFQTLLAHAANGSPEAKAIVSRCR